MGGQIDSEIRSAIIEVADLTVAASISMNDFIDVGTDRYSITQEPERNGRVVNLVLARRKTEGVSNPVLPAPDSDSGSGSGIAVNDLVFQNEGTVNKADNSNVDRPALGVAYEIDGSTVYHSRSTKILGVTPQGTQESGHTTWWLGTDGKVTFTRPSSGLRQVVGFGTVDNGDGTWDGTINIDSYIIFS